MKEKYIMAMDQGTTSSRCILFGREGNVKNIVQREFRQIYPKPGWVEHNPMDIWGSQAGAAAEAIASAGISPGDIAAIGIANQRETTVLWDRDTGTPVCNAIVWQCRRTADYCKALKEQGFGKIIAGKTGLVPDAYFSATKIKWVFDNVDGARRLAEEERLLFGTVDTWLLWNLTKGKVHATDYTNASRTMLFNINTLEWDAELLELFGIPGSILPKVMPSGANFGYTDKSVFGAEIPVTGVAGDQQAALFGQLCTDGGSVKNTYGTGCFLLMNTGEKAVESSKGLLTTLAAGYNARPQYALEGSIFAGGAVVQWLRDELKLIRDAEETETLALSVADNGGVYIVPAFTGLGAPYWNASARGAVFGLTRGAKKEHLARAALESMAYQTADVIKAMEEDSGIVLRSLKVDGGAAKNNFLMQFQADILNQTVIRPFISETTALGAAYLAGLYSGYWGGFSVLSGSKAGTDEFLPKMDKKTRLALTDGWRRAVNGALAWAGAD